MLRRYPAAASLPLVQAAQLAGEGKGEQADAVLASAASTAAAPQRRQHVQLMRAHLAASQAHPDQVWQGCHALLAELGLVLNLVLTRHAEGLQKEAL